MNDDEYLIIKTISNDYYFILSFTLSYYCCFLSHTMVGFTIAMHSLFIDSIIVFFIGCQDSLEIEIWKTDSIKILLYFIFWIHPFFFISFNYSKICWDNWSHCFIIFVVTMTFCPILHFKCKILISTSPCFSLSLFIKAYQIHCRVNLHMKPRIIDDTLVGCFTYRISSFSIFTTFSFGCHYIIFWYTQQKKEISSPFHTDCTSKESHRMDWLKHENNKKNQWFLEW